MYKTVCLSLLTLTALLAQPAAYETCIGCHGKKGETNTMVSVSKPNTMSKSAIVEALKGYKAGTLNKYDKGSMMRGYASRLSNAQMQEIADFIGK